MADTKERIWKTALCLFAQNGYEATSVRSIAEALGITKGALYRHYQSKRAVFDSILAHVYQKDAERSREAGIPEKEFSQTPEAFGQTSAKSVRAFLQMQFLYWTQDETACQFRKMLTLEQYGSPEMAALYQKIFTSGPVAYMQDLFGEMMQQGTVRGESPQQLAAECYAPFYLSLSLWDAAAKPDEKDRIATLFLSLLDAFLKRHAPTAP